MRGRLDLGDGDTCPLSPHHGQMYLLSGTQTQWCAHVAHDGRPMNHPMGPAVRSRAKWPFGHESFRKAVIQETLPTVDITLLGG